MHTVLPQSALGRPLDPNTGTQFTIGNETRMLWQLPVERPAGRIDAGYAKTLGQIAAEEQRGNVGRVQQSRKHYEARNRMQRYVGALGHIAQKGGTAEAKDYLSEAYRYHCDTGDYYGAMAQNHQAGTVPLKVVSLYDRLVSRYHNRRAEDIGERLAALMQPRSIFF